MTQDTFVTAYLKMGLLELSKRSSMARVVRLCLCVGLNSTLALHGLLRWWRCCCELLFIPNALCGAAGPR